MGWGDELMVTGHARLMQRTDPRKVRVVYERPRFHEAWLNNPRIAGKTEKGDFQEFVARIQGLRPYMTAKGDDQYLWKPYGPPPGEIYFTPEEQRYGELYRDRVVIEPHIKSGASPNKDWGWDNWVTLAGLLLVEGVQVAQLGTDGLRSVKGIERIRSPSMRAAAAVLANALAAVLPEGGLHHVCAAVRTPAVVIFGGYIAPEVTGYPGHVNIFTGGTDYPLGCGMRSPCLHCHDSLAQIHPAYVFDQLMGLLNEKRRRSLAT